MKILIVSILFAIGCAGPKASDGQPKFFATDSTITLDVDHQPDWLVRATLKSIATWQTHGLSFAIQADGELPIEAGQPPPGALGVYWTTGDIVITGEGADTPGFDCTLAHELGHAVGMMHMSQGGSMMSVVGGSWENGDCLWTDLDQAELDRVRLLTTQEASTYGSID